MVKLVTLVKQRAGITRDALLLQWQAEWRNAASITGLQRRVVNVAFLIPGREPRFDLVEESWWDRPEQIATALSSPPWRLWWDKTEELIELGQVVRLVVGERVIIPAPQDGRCVKTFNLIHRAPGRSFDSFDQHWAGVHAQLVMKLPLLRGYVQCPVLDAFGRKDPPDGVPVSWYDDIESGRISMRSEQRHPIDLDEVGFVARERTVRVVTTEVS